MRGLILFSLLSLFLASPRGWALHPSGKPSSPPLEEALPGDIPGYVKIRDLSEVKEKLRDHPLVSLWEEDEVAAFFKPLHEGSEGKDLFHDFYEELGINEEQFLKYFPGQWVVAIPDNLFGEEGKDDADESPSRLLYLTEYVGDLETLREMMQSSARYDSEKEGTEHRLKEEEYLEAPLFLEEVTDGDKIYMAGGYALVGDVLAVASPVELLKDTVARLKHEGGGPSLARTAAYGKVKERFRRSDLQVFLSLEPLAGKLNAYLENLSAGASPNIFGITAESVMKALALDVLEALYFSVTLDREASAIDTGLLYSDRRGLVRLISYQEGDLPQPSFIPDKVLTASVSLFSLRDFWKNLEEIVFQASPLLGNMYWGTLDQLNATIGLDLRSGLINNLGDEIILFSGLGKNESGVANTSLDNIDDVFIISIRDRQGMEMALEALKNYLGGGAELFEEREFLGSTIYTQKPELTSALGKVGLKPFSYALTDEYLLFSAGSASLLEESLARIGSDKQSLWDKIDLEDALTRFPERGVEINYKDFGALMHLVFVTLAKIQDNLENGGNSFVYCDPDSIPENIDFPYFLIAKIYLESGGLFGKSLLLKKSQ